MAANDEFARHLQKVLAGKMRGRLIDLSIGLNRKQRITVEVDQDFREKFDQLKDVELDVEIKKHRNRRSLSANAYFHVLVNKIAAERGGSVEATKESLVVEYGALATDDDGITVGFKLPVSVDVSTIYPYVKCFDTREENGRLFNCYLVYKQTHLMDSKEMARLIDGAIEVAHELGIETDTPDQIARFKDIWSRS